MKAPSSLLKEKDLKSMRDNFIKDILESESSIGSLDSRLDFKELNLNPVILDKDQLEQVNNNIYRYFRISENIIESSFTDEEWNAFYEAVIEPLAIQMNKPLQVQYLMKSQ